MHETLSYLDVCRMLEAAVTQIRTHHERLSLLDAAVGDGDHGTTILRCMEAVTNAIQASNGTDLKSLLSTIAWNVMDSDGGSTGPLLGSFFMGMSDALNPDTSDLDCPAAIAMFEGGILCVATQSRAKVGDKTMMDAFLPALEALQSAAPEGNIRSALQQAAQAAILGAESTKPLLAKFGRARNLGPRVIGHIDPGAVSVSLLFKGFSEAL
jgi:dihydroxyacetone kinase-like protein